MLAPWKARDRILEARARAARTPQPLSPDEQLLEDVRRHRAGAPLSAAAAQHLAEKLAGWREDPTARGIAFDAWLPAVPEPRMTTIATSVIMALADPHAHYVPPPA